MKIKKKSRPISDVEWFILWLVSSFIIIKCLMIYQGAEEHQQPDMKYLYLACGAVLLWLVATAKMQFGNIFALIRGVPKQFKKLFAEQREDLNRFDSGEVLEERKENE